MNKLSILRSLILTLAACLLVAGCGSSTEESNPYQEIYSADQITAVQINIKRGDIRIERAESNQTRLTISNLTPSGSVVLIGGVLQIDLPDSKPGDEISLSLARESDLEVIAYDGQINLIDAGGDIDIRSTAGNIRLLDFQGSQAVLWAGRGNITVTGGSGKAVVIGEHGNLDVRLFSGPVSMTTIMGEIRYSGDKTISGEVNLEADHGPILANLTESSNYQIQVVTASGEVICAGGRLEQTANGCRGVTGTGNESFTIRTVSGRIELQVRPGSD